MPDQTPEQREAALKLAKRIGTGIFHCEYDESVQLARAYTNLHAENVGLREALKNAPHAQTCDERFAPCPEPCEGCTTACLHHPRAVDKNCNCWKSRALCGSPATED